LHEASLPYDARAFTQIPNPAKDALYRHLLVPVQRTDIRIEAISLARQFAAGHRRTRRIARRVRIDAQPRNREMTRNIPICRADALDTGSRMLARVEGRSIVLFNIQGVVHAIDNTCPHNGASLASGRLDGHVLQCPAHGLRFDLVSGCLVGVKGVCLNKLSVETIDGNLVAQIDE
jgi:3-phenylpropionate/trans-cinnamate dioxygenase ferredoxin subunit